MQIPEVGGNIYFAVSYIREDRTQGTKREVFAITVLAGDTEATITDELLNICDLGSDWEYETSCQITQRAYNARR